MFLIACQTHLKKTMKKKDYAGRKKEKNLKGESAYNCSHYTRNPALEKITLFFSNK
jgi:hypothetical protein